MREYKITYKRNDMPSDFISSAIKWAHNSKDAVRLLLSRNQGRDKTVQFKRGGSGIILNVEDITDGECG
tara:strand:- start:492 stop:698 length:207 start_codon:yes stop_codon:yes gene_type:complete